MAPTFVLRPLLCWLDLRQPPPGSPALPPRSGTNVWWKSCWLSEQKLPESHRNGMNLVQWHACRLRTAPTRSLLAPLRSPDTHLGPSSRKSANLLTCKRWCKYVRLKTEEDRRALPFPQETPSFHVSNVKTTLFWVQSPRRLLLFVMEMEGSTCQAVKELGESVGIGSPTRDDQGRKDRSQKATLRCQPSRCQLVPWHAAQVSEPISPEKHSKTRNQERQSATASSSHPTRTTRPSTRCTSKATKKISSCVPRLPTRQDKSPYAAFRAESSSRFTTSETALSPLVAAPFRNDPAS